MKNHPLTALFLLALAAAPRTDAQGVSLELMTGSAFNFPSSLTVRQAGYPDLSFTADYDTNPFGHGTPYYALRVGLWEGDEAWEFGMLHHRLYLTNNPPEIQFFAIHYGYNFFLAGRAWRKGDLILHLDGGPILTSPENTVRGKVYYTGGGILGLGYHFSGFGFTGAVSRNIPITGPSFLVMEVVLSSGWTWGIPVVEGSADVPSVSLHGHIGLGVDL